MSILEFIVKTTALNSDVVVICDKQEVPSAITQATHPSAQPLLSDQLRPLRACSVLFSEQKAARGEH
ncbi:hypothetical protein EYZ11_003890 [Aspergillus tanneri]|uniref:Uncharacterized protein n=1 Tax=Aspergillus tanneri TaxID=1220188 RepID=A0A4S3JMJ0_9EURO|nr:hypothetical protein EYZ11_003890 [Aspergillus tanneri]